MSKEKIDIIDVIEYMDYKKVEERNLSDNYYNNEDLINNLKDSINASFKYGFEEGKKLGKSNEIKQYIFNGLQEPEVLEKLGLNI